MLANTSSPVFLIGCLCTLSNQFVGVTLPDCVAAKRVRRELGEHPAFGWPPAPQAQWQTALPYLRSPVQRTIWLKKPCDALQKCPLAGLAALAKRSMLAAPEHEVCSIDAAAWRALKQTHTDMQEVDADTPDALA